MKFWTEQDKNLINHYKTSKPIKVIDIIVICILLLAIIVCCILTIPSKDGENVYVYERGNLIGTYSLKSNNVIILLDGKMILTIENNNVKVSYSDCHNQICLKTGEISKVGERIVCAPNKITILIKGHNDVLITGGAK